MYNVIFYNIIKRTKERERIKLYFVVVVFFFLINVNKFIFSIFIDIYTIIYLHI